MTDLVRVTLRYDAGSAEIIRTVPIDGPVPATSLDLEPDSSGGWIEVADAAGIVVHRQPLPDPHAGTETFTRYKRLKRVRNGAPLIVAVELPWPGPGASLIVHARPPRRTARRGVEEDAGGGDASEIGRFAADASAAPVTRAAAPVAVRRPIWGHANPRALTLVFLPDGFTAAEMGAFHAMVDRCVAAIAATPPFDAMLSSLAIAEIEIASATSGIGTKPGDTPFRGRFQTDKLSRVILIDQEKASAVLDRAVRSSASALVVANSPIYDGSGGAATVFSCDPDWATEIAIHELGHSRFGLADEYDAAGQAATMKPVEANVCGSAERPKLKWADLVAPGTPLPTQSFGAPLPANTPIGAYEGAKYRQRGVFRATNDCKMRTPGVPFCPVCARVIRTVLAAHAPA